MFEVSLERAQLTWFCPLLDVYTRAIIKYAGKLVTTTTEANPNSNVGLH
jgi:hypothetical protein